MTAPFFVDTNVLIYADDPRDQVKKDRARQLIRDAFVSGNGHLSLQVLKEYFSVATRKLGLSALQARQRVEIYRQLQRRPNDNDDLLAAIDLHRLHGWSIWDALIVRSALVLGCARLYTEDLNHGQRIEGLEFVNPFIATYSVNE